MVSSTYARSAVVTLFSARCVRVPGQEPSSTAAPTIPVAAIPVASLSKPPATASGDDLRAETGSCTSPTSHEGVTSSQELCRGHGTGRHNVSGDQIVLQLKKLMR